VLFRSEIYPYFSRQSAQSIRERIIDSAAEFDIPLKPEQVKLEIVGDHLTIDIDYVKVVDLKVWSREYPFHIHRRGPY
jgi:hypothetical protein